MKVLGIVTEYNPFHNGHLYHLLKSREVTSADYTVAVMSGNFVQRGEPAIVNKWARSSMALSSGVDLVIELPVIYATASAEFFSWGAVKLLDSLGITDCICFGSESGEMEPLNLIAEILANEPEEYKKLLKTCLNMGLSFPAARAKALKEYDNSLAADQILRYSNNILAIEYLKALKKLNSRIEPFTIKRKSNLYTEENLTGEFSSAKAIRKCVSEGVDNSILLDNCLIKNTIPSESAEILNTEFMNGRGPVLFNDFENIILASLRKNSLDWIKLYPYITEGLENRIKNAAKSSGSLQELINNICSKRYTITRVQRIITSFLLNITQQEFERFNIYGGPQYIRVLGFNEKGTQLLSEINKNACLPVITKTADFTRTCNILLRRMLEIEALATDIYVLGYCNPDFRTGGQEYTQNPVRMLNKGSSAVNK